jgi:hypothetical protein
MQHFPLLNHTLLVNKSLIHYPSIYKLLSYEVYTCIWQWFMESRNCVTRTAISIDSFAVQEVAVLFPFYNKSQLLDFCANLCLSMYCVVFLILLCCFASWLTAA